MTKEKKFYGMRNDYMFHAVLQKNETVLRHLLATLLTFDESEIISCHLENPIELGKEMDGKDCILDVKLTLNDNSTVNIELQIRMETYWVNRSLLYWARAYDTLKSGQDYSNLMQTYHIGILDFTLFKDRPKFYSEYRILDVDDYYPYTNLFCIKVLDLTQVDVAEKDKIVSDTLIKWAKIFKAETMEDLEQLTCGEEVFQKMVFTLKQLSEDEKVRMQCEAREDYERRLLSEFHAGVEQEKIHTERERQRANHAEQRAEVAEKQNKKLMELLLKNGIEVEDK